jgi:hypothetical protein
MAIERLRSPYYVPTVNSPSAYLETPALGSTYTFTSIGQTGTVAGQLYRVHQFTSGLSGTLYFLNSGFVDIMLVGAGTPGGYAYYHAGTVGDALNTNYAGGGGGAGALMFIYKYRVETSIGYTFSVGVGGTGVGLTPGTNTVFGAFTALAGGRGGHYGGTGNSAGISGGSGGGASYHYYAGSGYPGLGVFTQGNQGGRCIGVGAAGGGGYATVGSNSITNAGGNGGNGVSINFDGIVRPMCAGGGGGSWAQNTPGNGGLVDGVITGGTGGSSSGAAWQNFNGSNPTALGCGGGGGGTNSAANGYGQYPGNGSSGIIIIRYPV